MNVRTNFRLHHFRRPLGPGVRVRRAGMGQDDSDISLFGDESVTPFEYSDTGDYLPSTESNLDLLAQGNQATSDLATAAGLPVSAVIGNVPSGATLSLPAAATSATSAISQILNAFNSPAPSASQSGAAPAGYTSIGGAQIPTAVLWGGAAIFAILMLSGGKRRR